MGKIHKDLLPVKAHYFFFFAALGPLLPQLNVFGRQLGVSPAVMGLVTAVLPILWAMAKPAVGYLVDYFQRQRKLIFVCLIVLMSGSYCCLYFLPQPPAILLSMTAPRIQTLASVCRGENISTCQDQIVPVKCHWLCPVPSIDQPETNRHSNYSKSSSQWDLFIRIQNSNFDLKTLTELFYNDTSEAIIKNCDILLSLENKTNSFDERKANNDSSIDVNVGHDTIDLDRLSMCFYQDGCNVFYCQVSGNHTIESDGKEIVLHDNVVYNKTLKYIKRNETEQEYFLYGTVTFWGFVVLMCIGTVSFNVANCISDAVCFDVLGDRGMQYGRQRVWGTIGYGLTALVSGWAVDVMSGADSTIKDFTPAFVLTVVFTVVDVYFCRRLELPQMSRAEGASGTLRVLLSRPAVLAFLFFAVIAGMFDSFIIYYMFWHLEELAVANNQMGSIKLLEGLTVAAESFGGEVLFFAISGKILKKFGFGHTLTFCLGCYSLRFFLISQITNSWFILPIELVMQGPTYALTYATIVGYAAAVAPPGLSATLQGIMAGMDDGFGFALGSLVGGMLYKYMGGSASFFLFGLVATTAALAHAVLLATVFKSYVGNAKPESEPEAEVPPDSDLESSPLQNIQEMGERDKNVEESNLKSAKECNGAL